MIKIVFSILFLDNAHSAYTRFSDGDRYGFISLVISIVVLFIADLVALPVEHVKDGIKYHHFWRTSVLKFSDIKWSDMGSGLSFEWMGHKDDLCFIGIGKHYWQVYFACFDTKNGLVKIYREQLNSDKKSE